MRKLLLILLITSTCPFAQKGITTFGIQYKPIIPNSLIGTYRQDFVDLPMDSYIQQKFGNVFGGIVRHGFTKNFSMETGINFTQRNFNTFHAIPDSSLSEKNDVRLVSYSIPLSALVFIRLSKQLYINASIGAAMTLFPSDVSVVTPATGTNDHFLMEAIYNSKLQGAMLTNIGFEYRTVRSGYFYIGASYHLPFTPIATAAMAYEYQAGDYVAIDKIKGSYLTLDLRYFFNEKREPKVGESEE